MYFLPSEVQLDIFKYLNFKQLLNVQLINGYFKNFINEYEEELARKKFDKLKFDSIKAYNLNSYIFVKPEPKLYEFELSKQLEKKWRSGIEEAIPMFLRASDMDKRDIFCQIEQSCFYEIEHDYEMKKEFCLPFPNRPKNIKEMKIARYLLEQLFNCAYESADFSSIIFNPQMIELLFDENKTNILPQFHCQRTELFIKNATECFFKFTLDYLISNELTVNFGIFLDIDKNEMDLLFKILTNEGNKFYKVCYGCQCLTELCKHIIKYIETSKDISKMVKEITFEDICGHFTLSQRAKNIKWEIKRYSKFVNYQLSNKYNPEMKFSIYHKEEYGGFYVELKGIN